MVLPFWLACTHNEPRKEVMPALPAPEVAALEEVNKQLTEKDRDIMEAFVRRKGWAMQHYPDGYYAMILKGGKGHEVKEGSRVECCCTIRLLDGTLCYARQQHKFTIGRTDEIMGLHKALLRLKEGAEARFIFPPHLAYGLPGDRDKIPARAILLFEVELLQVS
ncbi:MAG: FKBP-type peptidyl-prolyl cis-trans isomerase [Prevotellaceae bacterium]|jgi:FKBP-type peptidyl-prolyl cis-trans isomerase|nr:FKBP-type peptidyl-prolyl cis-trans isomerase [Prevotellaceae bacterium]